MQSKYSTKTRLSQTFSTHYERKSRKVIRSEERLPQWKMPRLFKTRGGSATQNYRGRNFKVCHQLNPWLHRLGPNRHANEYPTMHYFGISIHTRFMIAFTILTEYFWNFSENLHCGNVANMPYYHIWHIAVRSLTCSHNTDLFLSHVYSSLCVYLTVQISRLTIIHRYVQVSNLYNRYMVYKVD